MTVPNLPNTWRVTYAGTVSNNALYPWQVVWHVTAPTAAAPQTVANEAGAAWMVASGISSIQSTNIKYGLITVQSYDGVSAPLGCTVATYTGGQGGASGTAVSAQVSALVTKSSGLAGRRNRGRMYIPGLLTTQMNADGAQWSTTGVANIGAAVTTTIVKLKLGPTITDLVVYSARFNQKVSVTQTIARAYTGTQRRRSEPG